MPSSSRRRLLSPEALDRAARQIVEAARAQRVPVAAVGGYAMQVYGSDRLTADLDVAAARPIRGFSFVRRLTFGGSTVTSGGVPVDVIVRDDAYARLYRHAVKNAEVRPGIPIRVATAPYLVAMKIASGRPKDDLDVEFLLARMSRAEIEETREVIRRHLGVYAALNLDAMIEEARWMAKRGGDVRRRRRRLLR